MASKMNVYNNLIHLTTNPNEVYDGAKYINDTRANVKSVKDTKLMQQEQQDFF